MQRAVNDLLSYEINDPRLAGVRVSAVELSSDLSAARMYFNTLKPDEDPAPAQAAFMSASGFIRTRLGRALRMRRVPELRFAQDPGPRQGLRLSQLIDDAAAGGGSQGSEGSSDPTA
jgi:ribosome-binding factor A